jgi:transcriptional regulator with XRE-family HTH domain
MPHRRERKPNRIKELRLNQGEGNTKIGLKELAEGSEISVPFLNKLENNLVGTTAEVRARIARYLDVPVEDVFPNEAVEENERPDKKA